MKGGKEEKRSMCAYVIIILEIKILILFTLKHHPDFKCLAWLGDHLNIVTWFELTIL